MDFYETLHIDDLRGSNMTVSNKLNTGIMLALSLGNTKVPRKFMGKWANSSR